MYGERYPAPDKGRSVKSGPFLSLVCRHLCKHGQKRGMPREASAKPWPRRADRRARHRVEPRPSGPQVRRELAWCHCGTIGVPPLSSGLSSLTGMRV
jgi:hypothetical protein